MEKDTKTARAAYTAHAATAALFACQSELVSTDKFTFTFHLLTKPYVCCNYYVQCLIEGVFWIL